MKYRIDYEHSGNEHAPDWLSMEIDGESEDDAGDKFYFLGYYATEVIVTLLHDATADAFCRTSS